jgi:spermidine synthase
MLAAAFAAFTLGHLGRDILLAKAGKCMNKEVAEVVGRDRLLPRLCFENTATKTTYTSKHFDTSPPHRMDSVFAQDCSPDMAFTQSVREEDEDDGDREDDQQPQQLIVDIENVDGSFLNSEAMLLKSMIKLTKQADLTLLSYHCHALHPVGVGCVAVMPTGHVAFHTWPESGVISFDLLTIEELVLAEVVPLMKQLFGVRQESGGSVEPRIRWAHKRRGFRRGGMNPEDIDMDQYLLGVLEYEYKTPVASVQTKFQQIDIFEGINPRVRPGSESYVKSLADDGSYESRHREIFQPDRIVYLDNILQSRRFGDAAYHETLVHPALFAHENPRRVAIVGGGEGATLRECLKHRTVELVTMIEIDEEMVNVSRRYIPEWSDCSILAGSSSSCFDDPRAEVFFSDAVAWFIDRFGRQAEGEETAKYDVVIMDAL